MKKRIIFDIETGSLPFDKIAEVAPDFDPDSVKVGNLGIEKGMEKINEAKRSHMETIEKKAALNAEYGTVLAIGMQDESGQTLLVGGSEEAEVEILEEFWESVGDSYGRTGEYWIGHNILNFDLPFLFRRSMLLGVRVPRQVVPQFRYWPQDFWVDTFQIWGAGDWKKFVSLDHLCRSFGLPGKNGSGARFQELFEDPETHDESIEYLKNDLQITYDVSMKMLNCLYL
tara:strand:- start:23 stop:706 length:684 start_codon:yes stop_codon:yes gene_type:complete